MESLFSKILFHMDTLLPKSLYLEPKRVVDASTIEALEKDFQEALQELVSDASLERFRGEYETLFRALKKSHESERRLIKKCRELNQVRAWQRQRVGGGGASPNAVPLS